MQQGTEAKMIKPNTIRLSTNFLDYFVSLDRSKWVNGRPVLLNGDTWCERCQVWHKPSEKKD